MFFTHQVKKYFDYKSSNIIIVLLLFLKAVPGFCQDTSFVYLTSEIQNVSLGNLFNVQIKIKNIDSLYAVSFKIIYDRNIIQIDNITEGNFLNENNNVSTSFLYDIDNDKGEAIIGISRLGAMDSGVKSFIDTSIVTIRFRSINIGISYINFNKISLIAPDGITKYPCNFANTSVSVLVSTSIKNNDFKSINNRVINIYPNPFNSIVRINYHLNTNSHVEIKIFNIIGQFLRSLVNEYLQKGSYSELWDGKNENNITVSSGIYVVCLKINYDIYVNKVIFLK